MIKRVTASSLPPLGACPSQVRTFERLWPEGAELTEGNLHTAIENGLDVECWARHFLPAPLWAQYEEDVAPLLKQYLKALAPLRKQYRRDTAPLWGQYSQALDPFWAQYMKDCVPFLWQAIQKMQAN